MDENFRNAGRASGRGDSLSGAARVRGVSKRIRVPNRGHAGTSAGGKVYGVAPRSGVRRR